MQIDKPNQLLVLSTGDGRLINHTALAENEHLERPPLPIDENSVVLVSDRCTVKRFDLKHGQISWVVQESKINPNNPPRVLGNAETLLMLFDGSTLIRLDAATGKKRWETFLGENLSERPGSMALDRRNLYCVTIEVFAGKARSCAARHCDRRRFTSLVMSACRAARLGLGVVDRPFGAIDLRFSERHAVDRRGRSGELAGDRASPRGRRAHRAAGVSDGGFGSDLQSRSPPRDRGDGQGHLGIELEKRVDKQQETRSVSEQDAAEALKEEADIVAVERLKDAFGKLKGEMAKVIVGQHRVLEELLIAIFARGHCLLIGVPGLAKTLMIHTMADALNLTYNRIQFTPDLMPSDITGTEVIQEDKASGVRQFKFLRGPVFANIVLADEINRTPPKTQAALLEAMQERQVTVGGERHKLPDPFFVLATQNPIEQEGTYPLPEAQLDRFMLNIKVGYPSEEEELDIVRLTTSVVRPMVSKVLAGSDILALQELVRKVPIADHVSRYAVRLTRATRRDEANHLNFVRDYVSWGAGPRASQYLVLAAKARAVLHGAYHVSTDDIRAVAGPVLRHRIITNFNAEAEGLKPDDIVERLIKSVPVDEHEAEQSGKLPKIFRSANAS